MIFLEDGEMAELTADGVRIETLEGKPVERAPKHIDWSPVQAEKGGYKHFMLKEIFEQPRADRGHAARAHRVSRRAT